MKRLIPALILLFTVLGAYIGSNIYINKICDKTTSLIDKCIYSYENNGDAFKETKKLKEFWDQKEKFLSFFVNHSQIDQAELAISNMYVYAKKDNNIIFYEYSNTAKSILHQIIEDTEISTHSVF